MSSALEERYDARIAGVLSCYDRVVITGTLPPCVREVAARIGSRPQGALEDEHGSVWTDV